MVCLAVDGSALPLAFGFATVWPTYYPPRPDVCKEITYDALAFMRRCQPHQEEGNDKVSQEVMDVYLPGMPAADGFPYRAPLIDT